MNDEILFCPECNREIAVGAEICPYCGFPLKSNVADIEKSVSKPKQILGIAMIAVGIIFAFLAYKTRFMGDYDYNASVIEMYESNIIGYKDSKQEMLDEASRYSSSFFKSSYKDLANGYQKLIDYAEDKIDAYQSKQRSIVIKSVIMLLISIGLMGTGGYELKNQKKKRRFNDEGKN
jgi:hypothetical protein